MLGSNIFFKKSKISIRFNLPKVCLSIRVSFCICRVIYTFFQCFAVIFIFLLSLVAVSNV